MVSCAVQFKRFVLAVKTIVCDIIQFDQMCLVLRWCYENSALLPLQKNRNFINYGNQGGGVSCAIPIKRLVLPVITIVCDIIQFGQRCLVVLREFCTFTVAEKTVFLHLCSCRKTVFFCNIMVFLQDFLRLGCS